MNWHKFGRGAGVALMVAAFFWLTYLLISGDDVVHIWETVAMFWFGSSMYWQSCCHEEFV